MRKLTLVASCLLVVLGLAGPLQGIASAQTGKIVVIVEENARYGDIVGNSQAPYLNQLMSKGELFTNYAAVYGASNPNYLAMTSGLTSVQSPPSANVFQAIDGTGGTLRWKEFMESMTGTCAGGNAGSVPGTSVALYTADHDPDYQYRANTTCKTNDVPLTSSTFNPANLPDLSYVVPNECDDMHTLPANGQSCPAYFGADPGTSQINMGDNWLATVVPQLLAQPNVTVLITWDEGSNQTTPPQHVVALAAGAGITPGSTDGTAYTHYSLEAGLYRYFGLGPAPNNGATATPLPIPGTTTTPPPAPAVSSFTPASGAPGTSVTVTGSGFTGATAVTFNGSGAAFTVGSDTQLTATVPGAATTGPIAVTTPAGTGTSTASFTVTSNPPPPPPAPAVSSFTPASGAPGTSVTVTGSGFTGATAVTFNGSGAAFTVGSDTQLTATVPGAATTGPIAVTTPAGTGTSTASFTVTSNPTSPPPAPANLTAAPSGTAVSLSWTESDPTAGLQLYRSNDPGFGTYTTVSLPAGSTSYTDSSLTPAAYYYRLAAVNTAGQSPYATASAATISYAALVAGRPGLVAHWRLGETSGTTAADTTGSYNGTYLNGPALGSPGAIAGDPSTSVTFNGTNQRVKLPSVPSAGDFSIEGWTYLTNANVNNNTVYGGSGTVRLLARPGTGSYPYAAYAGVYLNGTEYYMQTRSPASNINTWVYWVLTRQGGTLTLYRNGTQIAQRTDLPATATANLNGYIAAQNNGAYYLTGRVQDVAVYSRALSSTDVINAYVAARNGVAPG